MRCSVHSLIRRPCLLWKKSTKQIIEVGKLDQTEGPQQQESQMDVRHKRAIFSGHRWPVSQEDTFGRWIGPPHPSWKSGNYKFTTPLVCVKIFPFFGVRISSAQTQKLNPPATFTTLNPLAILQTQWLFLYRSKNQRPWRKRVPTTYLSLLAIILGTYGLPCSVGYGVTKVDGLIYILLTISPGICTEAFFILRDGLRILSRSQNLKRHAHPR